MNEFCPTCEDYREGKEVEREELYTVRGTEITVPVTLTVCCTCGESLGSEEHDQEILDAVYAEYRRQNDLLTPERIRRIRKRYRLSQRSLAALLGMSEATVNRYENGALQDQVHDNAIRACEDPEYVRDLLDRRGHLLSEWQRDRVKGALVGEDESESLWIEILNVPGWRGTAREASYWTGFRRFDYERFAGTVVWFCRRLNGFYRTTINKLLFYADFLNYKTSTVSLTGTAYRRLQYGPVPADYGQLLARMEAEGLLECSETEFPDGKTGYYYRVGPDAERIAPEFTDHETTVLSKVADELGNRTAKEISDKSHQEAAWKETEEKKLISYEKAATLSVELHDSA